MLRKIVTIDEDKCNGCGLCITACHEGALQLVKGKAKLIADVYCDGLGACLPDCPTDAIAIIEREAVAFDQTEVDRHLAAQAAKTAAPPQSPCGCPGTQARLMSKQPVARSTGGTADAVSELRQWPVQIRLVPVQAPYFADAHLLIAADCTAFAYANIHRDFMQGKITLIGCPKLDDVHYAEKLTAILQAHNIQSLTVLRMEVPCCGGLEAAARQAVAACGKSIPFRVETISTSGELLGG